MSQSYLVTLKKATAVTHAVVGHFTGSSDSNLILAKISEICVHKVGRDGLVHVLDIPINGRVVGMNLFHSVNKMKDVLILITSKQHFFVLEWNEMSNSIETKVSCSVADRVRPILEHNSLITVHESGAICLRLYERTIKIVQLPELQEEKCLNQLNAYNIALNGTEVIDFTFMNSIDSMDKKLSFGYICKDSRGKHLYFSELSIPQYELTTTHGFNNIEETSTLIISVPQPYGGVIVISLNSLLYFKNEATFFNVEISFSPFKSFDCFSTFFQREMLRYVIMDAAGLVSVITLKPDKMNQQLLSMSVTKVGETSGPECLVQIEGNVFFVGSRCGDSVFYQIDQKLETFSLNILQTMPNIAPIRDLAIVNCGNKTQLITCSGARKNGSLRILENGIGVQHTVMFEISGIKRVFPVKVQSLLDNYLVLSSDDNTHILQIHDEEVEEVNLMGMSTSTSTLWTGLLANTNTILQVTPTVVNICSPNRNFECWYPAESLIDHVSVVPEHGEILIVCGAALYFLKWNNEHDSLQQVYKKELRSQVSCVDMTRIDGCESSVVAVGLWIENSTILMTTPYFDEITSDSLAEEMIPRFIKIVLNKCIVYLLVFLGDGQLYCFTVEMEKGVLNILEKLSVGSLPISVSKFERDGSMCVLVSSERPLLIFPGHGKLVFNDLLMNPVVDMMPLNSENYRNCFVILEDKSLSVVKMDSMSKLHISTVKAGESVKKVVHQEETDTLGILCERSENSTTSSISKLSPKITQAGTEEDASMEEVNENADQTIHSFVLLNAKTFEPLHTYEFPKNEHVVSIISTKLGDDPKTYYVVGTAIIHDGDFRVISGRITLFEAVIRTSQFLLKVYEKHLRGCPFSLSVLEKNLIVALSSSVRLFKWGREGLDLTLQCSYFNTLAASQLKVQGDLVVIDDILRSFGILRYNRTENVLEERARDYRGMCMTAMEFIDDDTVIGAEIGYNLLVGKLLSLPEINDYEIKEKGQYHIGEVVSVFCKGIVRASYLNTAFPVSSPLIYGTTDGSIGMIAQITLNNYKRLSALESIIIRKTPNYSGIPHSTYRRFEIEGSVEMAFGFIDGDVIESALKWSHEEQREAFESVTLPGEDISNPEQNVQRALQLVEEFARTH